MGRSDGVLVPLSGTPERKSWFWCPAQRAPARRLMVFVHGFGGSAVKTWQAFHTGAAVFGWWKSADLIFVGYDSLRHEIGGTASRLRTWLHLVFPTPAPGVLPTADGARYEELVLVGHSLGGVVLRIMLLEELTQRPNSPLLQARVMLFSPALNGFVPSGILGALRAGGFWGGIEAILSSSPTYNDLTHKTDKLRRLRQATETAAAAHPGVPGLRAHILWADPDGVVATAGYSTDLIPEWEIHRGHTGVCKPGSLYSRPWVFVEKGASA